MVVVPAIDLKNGKCVRLLQGQADQETVYSSDPAEMAKIFEDAGAKRLHLVDLDGAFKGKTANLQSIRAIIDSITIPVELGGGIRNGDDIKRMLDLEIDSVIVGTMAVKHPNILESVLKEYPGEKIILGVDSRNRKVAVAGWEEQTEIDDIAFGKRWKDHGIQRIIFTDIARDGMLNGPNIEALRQFARGTQLKITASGGISSKEDIENLQSLEADGVDHVIVGKAIYDKKIKLNELFSC
ncbi:MAG: 1-(5-phosphoribosyl)-5-[(5-phosphoribosylamino)methylideneamino]imidazole-4-carboxamide isomerase [SAR324 cluster bacterium]|nr:1-(5-phosphoribosyl)-5-[(5-phosphoribosylamino)methylideneamino]imidazole-4-carboxamide isomerase [SAR324 cluster bacterium]